MEPGQVMGGVSTALKTADLTQKGWGWVKKWWYGAIEINTPHNRGVVNPDPDGWVPVQGKHNKPKGAYWLVTHDGDKYWPQCRIKPHPDGNWVERVNVGPVKDQKLTFLILAWASDLVDAVFQDYKDRGRRTKDWGPITLKPTKRDMQVVQEIILTVVQKQ